MVTEHKICPVCERQDDQWQLVRIENVPLFCNVLHPDRESALQTAKGEIRLIYCTHCGHLYNSVFDPKKMHYSSSYENSLHFSPKFESYIQDLAAYLVKKYDLYGKTIVEIGCGKGDFLSLLCKLGENKGVGFDPTYKAERIPDNDRKQFKVIQDYYSEKYTDIHAHMVVCRQVLEHVQFPKRFFEILRHTVRNSMHTAIFFEVPNVMYTLKELGIWDLIYEHCGYFTINSLRHLFNVSGFRKVSVQPAFGGQYICMEAYPDNNVHLPFTSQKDNLADVAACASIFSDLYNKKVAQWRGRLKKMNKDGRRIVVWGAGSKGVTFINIMGENSGIEFLVDINPHKLGLYAPGGGQQIIGIESLKQIKPAFILVMNPIYLTEIKKMLDENQINAEVLLV
jgi:SAM-dependent methyltransferase